MCDRFCIFSFNFSITPSVDFIPNFSSTSGTDVLSGFRSRVEAAEQQEEQQ